MGKLTAEDLERQGGSAVDFYQTGPRLIKWYTPWGKMLMLPADPWSIEKYSRKGFTLRPPLHPEPEPVSGVGTYDTKVEAKDDEETRAAPATEQLRLFD